jgi:hypothetical protein
MRCGYGHRHESLTHKGELTKDGGRVLCPTDMAERTFGGFADLVASRPVNVIMCAEGASRLEETWAKTLSHKRIQQWSVLGKGR